MYLYRYGGVYMDTDYTCLRPWGQVAGLLPPGHAVRGSGTGALGRSECKTGQVLICGSSLTSGARPCK